MKTLRILFFGDLVGGPGCAMFQKHASQLKEKYAANAIVVNGENSAPNGRGITEKHFNVLKASGADVVTGGNHSFQQKEIYSVLTQRKDLLRPINFPSTCPGSGVGIYMIDDIAFGVINVQGRIFMREHLSCPFRAVESALTLVHSKTRVILVDMHAEASSEKAAMAWYFDGQVSAVIGTHTHVQTADERILSKGTAFLTDAGMAGAYNSFIGMQNGPIIHQMLTQMPSKFEVEHNPPYFLCGVVIDVDVMSGKAVAIERFKIIDQELKVEPEKKEQKKKIF